MNISNNISSIQAHQTMMNTNANNVANVNSDGFRPSDTRINENKNSVSAYTVKTDDTKSPNSQTDLTKEIPKQISIEAATQANVSSVKAQDEVMGTLLDIKA